MGFWEERVEYMMILSLCWGGREAFFYRHTSAVGGGEGRAYDDFTTLEGRETVSNRPTGGSGRGG